jgi:hypothetical protein
MTVHYSGGLKGSSSITYFRFGIFIKEIHKVLLAKHDQAEQ